MIKEIIFSNKGRVIKKILLIFLVSRVYAGSDVSIQNKVGENNQNLVSIEQSEKICSTPAYPAASRRAGEKGVVQLKYLIDSDGHVVKTIIEKSSGFNRLDEAAANAFSKCQFKPLVEDGKAISSWSSLTYIWDIKD
jgi:TonB family protein